MMQAPNPEMLILAREVRRKSQTQLAQESGIDQGRISRYEGGVKLIPDDELRILASTLSFPVEFFYQEGKRYGVETAEIFHRKRQTVSSIDQKSIDSLMNVFRLGMTHLLRGLEEISELSIPTFRVYEFNGDIEEIARMVRAGWRMPSGPVNNLVEQLEAASCMIISCDFGTDKIDEAVQWIEPLPPIILINKHSPGDRLRFTLAHALGHLIMHHDQIPYPKMEEEADRFASAFLMPADDIRHELIPVTIDHMLQLKPYWKVSIQALIRRAHDLKEISDRRYTSLFETLSRLGYRKNEPHPIEPERPQLIQDLLNLYREQRNFSKAELAKLTRLNFNDFLAWYMEAPHLTVIDSGSRSVLRKEDTNNMAPDRSRNKDGTWRRKRSDTHVGNIEKKYNVDFNVRSDMTLGTLRDKLEVDSQSDALETIENDDD